MDRIKVASHLTARIKTLIELNLDFLGMLRYAVYIIIAESIYYLL